MPDGSPGTPVQRGQPVSAAPQPQPEQVAAPPQPKIEDTTDAGIADRRHVEDANVDLSRVGWLAVVIVCAITVLILVVQGYYGYAGVTLAVAISAAINLT